MDASSPTTNYDLNQTLLSWKSPSHPFKKRNRTYYQTVAALTFLLVVIVFFLKDFLLIGVILSVAFVVYAISSVPPVEMEHKITPLGILHGGKMHKWNELVCFWFEKKWGHDALVVLTKDGFPAQLRMVVEGNSRKKVQDILNQHMLFAEQPPKSVVDKASDWFGKRFPLEKAI